MVREFTKFGNTQPPGGLGIYQAPPTEILAFSIERRPQDGALGGVPDRNPRIFDRTAPSWYLPRLVNTQPTGGLGIYPAPPTGILAFSMERRPQDGALEGVPDKNRHIVDRTPPSGYLANLVNTQRAQFCRKCEDFAWRRLQGPHLEGAVLSKMRGFLSGALGKYPTPGGLGIYQIW